MPTAILSDLHLGAANDSDLLRQEPVLERACEAVAGCDRLILLGDVIELRDRPVTRALQLALPVISRLAAAAGPEAEIVIVPGNHDHRLISSWAEAELAQGRPLSELEARPPADWPAAPLLAAAGPKARLSYPGIWVRDDVYATHGHYLDRHLTIPTFERLGVALVERTIGEPVPKARELPAAYERVQAPVYAFLYGLAQGASETGAGGTPSRRIWEALSGGKGIFGRARGFMLGSVALPGAVAVANRLGLGPVSADVSPGALARGGIRAMNTVGERLGLAEAGARHLVFGHTHRRGPLPSEGAWTGSVGRISMYNCGSWVHVPSLLGPAAAASGYWPGTMTVVGADGPPRLIHLLDDWSREELATIAAGTPLKAAELG